MGRDVAANYGGGGGESEGVEAGGVVGFWTLVIDGME